MVQGISLGTILNKYIYETTTQGKNMDILEVIRTVKKHISLVVVMTLVCAAISTALALLLPRAYESTAVVILQQQGGGISLGSAASLLGLPTSPQGISTDLLKVIASSDSIATNVIDKLGLRKNKNFSKPEDDNEDLLLRFHKNLKIVADDMTLRITFANPDAGLATSVANEIAAQSVEYIKDTSVRNFNDYNRMLEMYQEQLKGVELKIKNYEKLHGVVQMDAQLSSAIETAALYQQRTVEAQTELESLAAVIENTTDLNLWTSTTQRMEALKDEIRLYKAKAIELEGAMRSAPEVKREYVELLRDQKTISLKLATVDSQRDLSLFDTERLSEKMRILDKAYPSKSSARPKRKLIVAFGLAFGLFSSMSLAFLIEMLKVGATQNTDGASSA
jgi:uncharacterized protein involved in exopolysaccharide biosynthesis